MLCDDVLDHLRQPGFLGPPQSVGHVLNDDLRTLFGLKGIVRIHTALVFGEECRVVNLPDVVIERTGAHELHIRPHLQRHLLSHVGHLEGVLEGARTTLGQFAQRAVVDVAQFHQGH